MKSLARFGVKAEASGRNDLVYQGAKISGSAYKLNPGKNAKALHHGTILFNVDPTAIEKYLNPNKLKLQSKGIESVKSRILNLSIVHPDINHDKFAKVLA